MDQVDTPRRRLWNSCLWKFVYVLLDEPAYQLLKFPNPLRVPAGRSQLFQHLVELDGWFAALSLAFRIGELEELLSGQSHRAGDVHDVLEPQLDLAAEEPGQVAWRIAQPALDLAVGEAQEAEGRPQHADDALGLFFGFGLHDVIVQPLGLYARGSAVLDEL